MSVPLSAVWLAWAPPAQTAPVVPVAQAISVATSFNPYPYSNAYSCSSLHQASWNCDTPIGPPPLLGQPAVEVSASSDKGSGGATSLYLVLEFDRSRGSKVLQNVTSVKLQYNVTDGSTGGAGLGVLISAAPDAPPDVLAYSAYGDRKQPRPSCTPLPAVGGTRLTDTPRRHVR